MELTRKQVIEELQKMLDYCSIRQDSTPERKQALVYVISSLKTDETYQIMYEGGEIFTKADMVAMLTDTKDKLKHCEIAGLWKANYREGFNDGVSKSLDAIQEKINELKENTDDKYKPHESIK